MWGWTVGVVAVVWGLGTVWGASGQQEEGLKALGGEWVFVEDRTEGRALEQLGPPMSSRFSMSVEDGAVTLVRGHGSGHKDVRVALDGTVTEVPGQNETARYRGEWKDDVFTYVVDFVSGGNPTPRTVIRREFQVTPDGLIVRFRDAVALYRHEKDIVLPTPAKAAIGDMGWLAGAWVGTRGAEGATSIEERWSPPLGGAMLASSRTVTGGKMRAFEFLRIVERDGGLVYIAQPGGGVATEFVLTEISGTRAVFDNPLHDYPRRIVYELSAGGGLTATIGQIKGGTPRKFEFKREAGK